MALLEITDTQLLAWIQSIFWPFVRISALLIAAPIFGARTVPNRARMLLALLLAFIVAPWVEVNSQISPFSFAGAVVLLQEVIIGVTLGFFVQMMFAAMAMAGELVALSMGLAFASMVDPERGNSVPLVGQYFVVFTTLLFLAFDGHLAVLTLLIESFTPYPPGGAMLAMGTFWELANWGSRMFEAAVYVALPASAALILTNVSMGMVARSAPQLNIFAVGFPLTLLLGMLFLFMALPALGTQWESVLDNGFSFIGRLLGVRA